MKILFIVDDFAGGAGNVIQILANEFLNRGNDVNVLLLNYHTDNNRLDKKVRVLRKSITGQNTKNKLQWLIQTIKEINKIITDLDPYVVISFLNNNNTLVGLSLMFEDVPLVVSERSNPIKIKPKLIWRLLRIPAYLRANEIIVQCSNFINFNRLFTKKTSVIPNPIINPSFNKSSNRNNNVTRIVSVGRLAKIKQFDLMIKAFAKINNKISSTELYIYGEGPERENLEKLIKQLSLQEKVFLSGKTNKVYDILNDSDIYLMTSKQEGFPNALCEAMATGLPVVAFECHEGLRDIVDNGINGFLVAIDDIDKMVEYTCLLIEDRNLKYKLSEKAVSITKKFSVSNVLNMWEEVISRVGDVNR